MAHSFTNTTGCSLTNNGKQYHEHSALLYSHHNISTYVDTSVDFSVNHYRKNAKSPTRISLSQSRNAKVCPESPLKDTYYDPSKAPCELSEYEYERRQQSILESIALLVGSPIGGHVNGTIGSGGGSQSLAGVSRYGQPSVSSAALQEVLDRVEGHGDDAAHCRNLGRRKRIEYRPPYQEKGAGTPAAINKVVRHSTGEMPHIFPKGLSPIQRFTLASAPSQSVADGKNMIGTHQEIHNTTNVFDRKEGSSQFNGSITHKPIQSLWALLSMGADVNRVIRLLERE